MTENMITMGFHSAFRKMPFWKRNDWVTKFPQCQNDSLKKFSRSMQLSHWHQLHQHSLFIRPSKTCRNYLYLIFPVSVCQKMGEHFVRSVAQNVGLIAEGGKILPLYEQPRKKCLKMKKFLYNKSLNQRFRMKIPHTGVNL